MGAEVHGPDHATRTVSAALAQRGFAVLLPDYHRGAGPVDRENYEDFTEVTGAIAALDFRRAFLDTAAAVDHLREPRLQRTQRSSAPRRRRPRRMGGGSRSSSVISPRETRTAARDRDVIPVGDAGHHRGPGPVRDRTTTLWVRI
jgi:hypothetical protein